MYGQSQNLIRDYTTAARRKSVLRQKQNISIIDKGLTIEGKIITNGRVIIKGQMNGTLQGEAVTIAEGGTVHADVTAHQMIISGSFKGVVHASEELRILSSGRCSGKLICKHLVVDAGAILDAEVNSGNMEPDRLNKPAGTSAVAIDE